MALSGSFKTTGGYEGREYQFSWSATQSVANNTSTISWTLDAVGGSSGYYIERTVNVVVAGETVFSKTNEVQRYAGRVASGTKVVTHRADGTQSFSASVEAASYYGAINSRGSASYDLNTIARATTPTLSASTTAMNSAVTINTPRASSSFTHTLRYAFGKTSGTIATGVGTSKSWTIPLSLANQIPNATSGTGIIYCDTYNGSTLIGTKTVNFTTTVPSSVVPSISSVALSDPNGYASTYGGYVQHKSKLKVQVTSAGSYSSTISKVSITANGATVATNPYTTNTLTASAGSKSVSVTVTDSRGRTATKTASYTIVGYSAPSITNLSAIRCTSDGTASEDGDYMKITYAGSINSLSNKNTKSFVVTYKESSATSWTSAASSTSAYSVNTSVIVAADTEKTYDVKFTVTDAFSSTSKTSNISTAFTLVDYNASGHAMAIGKVSEVDNMFEVGMSTRVSKEVQVGECLRLTRGIYGSMWFPDGGSTLYLLFTEKDKPYGSFNSLRPLTVNMATGAVSMGHGLTVTGTITAKSGNIASGGYVRAGGELQSTTANGLRIVAGNYGFFIRNDGNTTYFMFTKSGDQYGSYGDLRPLFINNSTGNVGMGHALSVNGALSTGSTLSVKGASTLTGAVTAKSSMSVSGTLTVTNINCSGRVSSPKFTSGGNTLRLCSNSIATITNDAINTYVPIQASSFQQQSSEKVKENIVDITEEEATKILDVNVVSFDYKENFGGKKNNFGVIAEEVVDVIPSAVNIPDDYDEDEFDESKGISQPIPSVDYSKFVPHLIKMVQMQQKEIDELKSRLEKVENSKLA